MVEIKNIKLQGDIISCDYYPEGNREERCYLAVNVLTGLIVNHLHREDEWPAYADHTVARLLEICNNNPLPDTSTVMWY